MRIPAVQPAVRFGQAKPYLQDLLVFSRNPAESREALLEKVERLAEENRLRDQLEIVDATTGMMLIKASPALVTVLRQMLPDLTIREKRFEGLP